MAMPPAVDPSADPSDDRRAEPRASRHEPRSWRGLGRHYLGDLVYGASDGIVTTFAVVSSVAGAGMSTGTALVLGLANLFADGLSMGASNWLAIRSGQAARAAQGQPPDEPFPARHGLATFAAFLFAGAVPMVAYAFAPPALRLHVALPAVLATLFVVGALRALVTPLRWWRAGVEMTAVGAFAAAVAFTVGRLARDLV